MLKYHLTACDVAEGLLCALLNGQDNSAINYNQDLARTAVKSFLCLD